MSSNRPLLGDLVRVLAAWWIGLTAVAVTSAYLTSAGLQSYRTPWGLIDTVAGSLWLVFPFVAFVAGSAASRHPSRGRAAAHASAVIVAGATVAYLCGALLAPAAEYRRLASVGIDVSVRFPFGPNTPEAFARRRAAIVRSPPERYTFSMDRPLELPPNWVSYQIHAPLAITVFALPNALLGLLIGWLTTGLSPPGRRQARWASGLLSAIAFLVAAQVGTQWVRAAPEHSAVTAAWAPLAVPLSLCVALSVVLWRRGRLHASAERDV